MQNILVTGGAGYIGSHIIELLVKKNLNTIILDNLSTGHKELINKKSKFIKADIKNLTILKKIIKDENITSIIHLAACLNVSEAEAKPRKYYCNNVLGTINLVKACKKSKVKNIIFSSSCSIYGSVEGAISEKREPNPMGKYSSSKLSGENIIKKYSKKYNYNYAILRYFNVVGASNSGDIGEVERSHNHLFKNIAISSLKKKSVMNIYGKNFNTHDGTCIRDYMHVMDLAEIHVKCLKKTYNEKKSAILNCGYARGFSVMEIVEKFKKIHNKKVTVYYKKPRLGDVASAYSNITKLKKFVSWRPKYNNLELMIKSAIKWEKKLKNKKG
ncbi:UDP-glucose 4-epimerase GalE [Candidatus Pelagibacter sp. Uisw_137]|uniref:UDP-glucose 4-epimerase GalE n=1 Tax=Candidatus Pelagibacter sp. Uisw_137 TaxID=3230992 RepID=UPI0039E8431D